MNDRLIEAISKSLAANWDRDALSDFHGKTFTYGELAARVAHLHILYRAAGLKPGDRVAICAKNSAEWAATFLGALTYGAVVVPLLHEFQPGNITHLVTHAEARLLFTERAIAENLDMERMPDVEGVLLLGDLEVVSDRSGKLQSAVDALDSMFTRLYPEGYKPEDIRYAAPSSADLALINYTSGSTGNSKGVMVTYGNLWGNIGFALGQIDFLHPGDGMLSMLPLAHMYGLVFEFLFPLCKGCHITFLGRVPSPKVLLEAFAQVRPQLVITVPLVIEKIVRGKVFPVLKKPAVRFLTSIPGLRRLVYSRIRRQLVDALGGNLRQLILGGAPLTADVEEFLRKIRFPFTIGYGMTECAPLVTYEWWATQRPHSCGRVVDGMQVRIDSPDPATIPGVLYLKGPNVMKGYFKNEEATREALSEDGWLNTGDICTMDADGYLYIRGREKNMILGPSGQNIYPEEVEIILNELPLVGESVVVERGGKLVALVHPDYEAARKDGLSEAKANEKVSALLPVLNKALPSYARVSEIEIRPEEFEKTPKHSIRRFIYK
ncbi:MAG: AMP-binding protein [Muribaculaceae bacterium]|nr:AMP-binding protein [Muribaculaceae bacterium]